MQLFPTHPVRGEMITLHLNPQLAPVAHDVIVTSLSGTVVARYRLAAGETQAFLPSGNLEKGLYNFTVYENGKHVDNGKVIVR